MSWGGCARQPALALLAAWALLAAACVPTRWDAEGWAQSRPELAGRALGRLGDATPYLVAGEGALHAFWCRWPLDEPLAVALPEDATPDERALLRRALEAWEQALPGLHFSLDSGTRGLRMRFADAGTETATSAVDCELRPPWRGSGELAARLVSAELVLPRGELDRWGRPIALTRAERLASAAHEIGHALGFQGHARRGPSVMVRDVTRLRRIGRRLDAGGSLDEAALAAVYALPSGTRVARQPLPAGASAEVDALGRRARERGLETLLLRVGDRAARVAWGGEEEFSYILREPDRALRKGWVFSEMLRVGPRAPALPGR